MNNTTLNMTTLDGGNVIIKKGNASAPPSGGESNIEYLDVRNVDDMIKRMLPYYSIFAKIQGEDVVLGVQIMPSGFLASTGGIIDYVTAVAIDLSSPITKYTSLGEADKQELTTLDAESGFMEALNAIPRITEEEFYTLD